MAGSDDGSVASLGQVMGLRRMGGDAVGIAKKVRTRAAPSIDAPDETPPDEAVPPQPDGRKCCTCSCHDNDPDPVDGRNFAWWYPTYPNDKTQGNMCWYCGKAWHLKFRHNANTKTYVQLVEVMGRDTEVHTAFVNLREIILNNDVSLKTRNFRATK